MDYSDTHDLVGTFLVPKVQSVEPLAEAIEPAMFEHLDIARYKARLERRLASASTEADAPHLTADQRQYATGMKHGLSIALRLLLGTKLQAAPALSDDPQSLPDV